MNSRRCEGIGKLGLIVCLCLVLGVVRPAHPEPASAAATPSTTSAHDGRWRDIADVLFQHNLDKDMRFAAAITQDGQGFLWLATQVGLVRWDGYHAKTYHADPQDPSALPDNYITAVHTDDQGRLWVGTSTAGLARYDPQLDHFIVTGAGAGGLDDPAISALAADGSRGLWVGTVKGLNHLDLATNAIRREALGQADTGAVKAVLQDPDGGLWVGTEKGLLYRAPQSADFIPVLLDTRSGLPPAVFALLRDSAGNLWIGTRPYGAFVLERGTSRPRAVVETGDASSLQSESILSIVEPTPGEIWLGSSGRGIVSIDLTTWKTHRLRHHVDESSTLKDDDVHSMYRDRSGLIWVSSTLAFSMHDPRIKGISTLFGASDGDRPITAVEVPFVLPMPDGRVWLSVGDEGGIDVLDPRLGRVAELKGKPDHPEHNLPPSRVLTMASAPDGDVYIGTRHGLYRADRQARQVTRVDIPTRPVDAGIWTLLWIDDVLWLGGVDGLWALHPDPRGATVVVRHFTREQFANQRVVTLLSAPGHMLWVGMSSGLSRLDTVSGEIENIPPNSADPHSLWPGYVASMLIDRQGRLWVGSDGAGIQILEGRDAAGRPRFRRLGLRDGLPHMGVDKLLLDAQGMVWVSTDAGLAKIDPDTFAIRSFGVAQGVPILEYWADSGAVTADGDLLFGGQLGLMVVRPLEIEHPSFHPPVVLTEASVGGRPVNASLFNDPASPARMDIPGENRSLMVEFSALDFTSPEENRYSYRLQGFDASWNSTSSARRLASYTNLPPGDYVLQLRGSDHDPPWKATTLSIPVRVLPAWYQTLWFKLVAGLVLMLVMAALVHFRTAVLRRRQRELESLVDRRTADLQQRSAELESSTQELRASQQKLERMAYFDPLTGLANRRLFTEELHRMNALALRGTLCFRLLLIDLDRFKQVNDNLGHDVGDALLVEVARRLMAVSRETDRVCRLGGDEFAILLPHSVDAEAGDDAVCERLLTALCKPFSHGDSILSPGATIGAANCPDDATDVEVLYKCADLALYEAKNAGRGTWRWYTPAPHRVASECRLEADTLQSKVLE